MVSCVRNSYLLSEFLCPHGHDQNCLSARPIKGTFSATEFVCPASDDGLESKHFRRALFVTAILILATMTCWNQFQNGGADRSVARRVRLSAVHTRRRCRRTRRMGLRDARLFTLQTSPRPTLESVHFRCKPARFRKCSRESTERRRGGVPSASGRPSRCRG